MVVYWNNGPNNFLTRFKVERFDLYNLQRHLSSIFVFIVSECSPSTEKTYDSKRTLFDEKNVVQNGIELVNLGSSFHYASHSSYWAKIFHSLPLLLYFSV